MRKDVRGALCFLAVVLTGLMSGLMLGTGMDQYTHRLLNAGAWVTEHQVMDALFRRWLPPSWNLTTALLAVAAVFSRGRARFFFAVAAVIFLGSLIVTVVVEVPINRTVATWNVDALPENWAAVRDRWLHFHVARTVGGLLAFLSALRGLQKSTDRLAGTPEKAA